MGVGFWDGISGSFHYAVGDASGLGKTGQGVQIEDYRSFASNTAISAAIDCQRQQTGITIFWRMLPDVALSFWRLGA